MFPKKIGTQSIRKRLVDNPNIQSKINNRVDFVTFNPKGYYSNSTDLIEIHKYSIKYLTEEHENVNSIKHKINLLKEKNNTHVMTIVDRKALEKDIIALEKSLSKDNKVDKFLDRVKPIIDEWTEKFQKTTLRLGSGNKVDLDNIFLIRSYLSIANEFNIPLNMTVEVTNKNNICADCQNPYEDDEDQIICNTCNYFKDKMKTDISFSDISRINTGNINNYTEEETFEWAMTCFQGKQTNNIPEIVHTKFQEYCKAKNIRTEFIKPIEGIAIFQKIGYSDYHNIYLFLSIYYDWKLADLTSYEEFLRQDNRLFIQAYEEVKVDRDSAPNAFYRLYIFIRHRKIPCDVSSLKIPFMRTTKIDLDFNARRAFEKLGWEFEDTT